MASRCCCQTSRLTTISCAFNEKKETKKAVKIIEQNNLVVNIENVRFRKISVQDVKDTLDKKCDQNNQPRVSISSIQKYIKNAKKFKKPQNVIY